MDVVIVTLVNLTVVPFTSAIPFVVSSGIAFLVFAVLWTRFSVALVRDGSQLDSDWRWVRSRSLPVQGIVWLLFMPVLLGLWVWRSKWSVAARLVVVAGLAFWSLLIFVPTSNAGPVFGIAAASVAYLAVVRPYINRWGATDEEVVKDLPGDELSNAFGDRRISTRAITIDATPDEIWPWLVQMGSSRAGFYTHEWLERLLGITYADGHSADHLHPEFQVLQVGDLVPYSRFNKVVVTALDRPRCLIAGEWLVLEPLDGGTRTRLIARTRGSWLEYALGLVPVLGLVLGPVGGLIDRGPGELLHHYMETGMLKGIKARAESARSATQSSAPVIEQRARVERHAL
jgi:hypothetical protein